MGRDEVQDDKPVLIDGLDELSERVEGYALGKVFERLAQANWPPFVLSCRAADWDLRSGQDLIGAPTSKPIVFSLNPFTSDQAEVFLRNEFPIIDARRVIEHLGRHDLQELMGNPLTLGLIGKVASDNQGLPETKGKLFRQATKILVSEHNQAYVHSVQSQEPERVMESASDPRGHGRGIFLVFWYGSNAPSGRKIKRRPDGEPKPQSAAQMRNMIFARISDHRRAQLDVVVLDFERKEST